jgi:hypothetical protein
MSADLEMVSWLRKTTETVKARAEAQVLRTWPSVEAAGKHYGSLDSGVLEALERIARCEADLAILDEHYILTKDDRSEEWEELSIYNIGSADKDHGCVACHYYTQGAVKGYGVCRTVRFLAAGYRYRDGYQASWAP